MLPTHISNHHADQLPRQEGFRQFLSPPPPCIDERHQFSSSGGVNRGYENVAYNHQDGDANHANYPSHNSHQYHNPSQPWYDDHQNESHQHEKQTYRTNMTWQDHELQAFSPHAPRGSQFPMPLRQRPISSSSQPSPSPTDESADATLLLRTLAFINTLSPAPFYPPRISHPILIPQLPPSRGLGTPFLRAWAPCLVSSDLNADSLLAFIDNLNVISLPSSPMQVLNLAGSVVGMVPHHWAQLAGLGMQASAQVGTKVVSKARTNAFLKQVNDRVFLPRRLRVRLIKGEEIPRLLRMPEWRSIVEGDWDELLLEKVLRNVQQYTAELARHELPVPEAQMGLLDKWSAKALEREKSKNTKKALKKHEEEMEKAGKRTRKHQKKQEKRNQKHKKQGKERSKESSDSESNTDQGSDGNRKSGKAKEKQEKEARKLLWILIENV